MTAPAGPFLSKPRCGMPRERLHWVTIAEEGRDDYAEDVVIQQGNRAGFRHKLQVPPRAQLPLPLPVPMRYTVTVEVDQFKSARTVGIFALLGTGERPKRFVAQAPHGGGERAPAAAPPASVPATPAPRAEETRAIPPAPVAPPPAAAAPSEAFAATHVLKRGGPDLRRSVCQAETGRQIDQGHGGARGGEDATQDGHQDRGVGQSRDPDRNRRMAAGKRTDGPEMNSRAPSRCAFMARVMFIAALLFAAATARAQGSGTGAVEPVSQAEIAEIRQAFQGIGLREADVVRSQDGRVTLTGEYENRDAVGTAFAVARAVVGLRRVAPTTPSNIKYRLKGFDTAFASTVGKMMQRSAPKPAAAPPIFLRRPRRLSPAAPAPTAW